MTTKARVISIIFIFFLGHFSIAQAWQWEWGNSSTNNGTDSWVKVVGCDILNNTYGISNYDSVIYLTDTSFHHPEQYSLNGNYAITKYDSEGKLIKALDFYTLPGESLHNLFLATDNELNLYFSVAFSKTIYFQNVIINTNPSPYPSHPDVIVGKLNKDYHIQWWGLLSSDLQDDTRGMVVSKDNSVYLSCTHLANTDTMQVNYLNQDTSEIFTHPINSITKLDSEGNLKWVREIRSLYHGPGSRDLFIGEDDFLYFLGYSYSHFYIGEDTIYHPAYPAPEVTSMRYLLKFDQDGELLDGFFFNWDIWLWDVRVDENSDYYISGVLQDTVNIGNDILHIPDGEHWGILGKFDQQLNPVWYQTLNKTSLPWSHLRDGSLFFSGTAEGDAQIADTSFSFGNYSELIAGEFNSEGELVNIIASECSKDLVAYYAYTDNCGNPIMGGGFKGMAIFGNDTIYSESNENYDGLITKITRTIPNEINIGPDTLVCDHFTLIGPEGYSYYSLNGELSTQNIFEIAESGAYHFGCANESGCWSYDTINVDIYHGTNVYLGNDTLVRDIDTITFVISHPYDSFLWSDGSTNNSITLIGNQLGIGEFPIWVQVTDGPCNLIDTLMLTVKDSYGIGEYSNNTINIYPNPFNDNFTLEIEPGFRRLKISDINGKTIYIKSLTSTNKTEFIELEDFPEGIYFINVETDKASLVQKIIKIQ